MLPMMNEKKSSKVGKRGSDMDRSRAVECMCEADEIARNRFCTVSMLHKMRIYFTNNYPDCVNDIWAQFMNAWPDHGPSPSFIEVMNDVIANPENYNAKRNHPHGLYERVFGANLIKIMHAEGRRTQGCMSMFWLFIVLCYQTVYPNEAKALECTEDEFVTHYLPGLKADPRCKTYGEDVAIEEKALLMQAVHIAKILLTFFPHLQSYNRIIHNTIVLAHQKNKKYALGSNISGPARCREMIVEMVYARKHIWYYHGSSSSISGSNDYYEEELVVSVVISGSRSDYDADDAPLDDQDYDSTMASLDFPLENEYHLSLPTNASSVIQEPVINNNDTAMIIAYHHQGYNHHEQEEQLMVAPLDDDNDVFWTGYNSSAFPIIIGHENQTIGNKKRNRKMMMVEEDDLAVDWEMVQVSFAYGDDDNINSIIARKPTKKSKKQRL